MLNSVLRFIRLICLGDDSFMMNVVTRGISDAL